MSAPTHTPVRPDATQSGAQTLLQLSHLLDANAMAASSSALEQVSIPQLRLLDALGAGPSNAVSLAARLGLYPSSVTRLCDRLLAAGLITRDLSASNRREVVLDLTSEGSELLAAHRSARIDALDSVLERIPSAERAALLAALTPLIEVLTPAQPGTLPPLP